MPDIALIGDRNFLFEKLFLDLGVTFQFVQSSLLGSPFLPKFKMIIIPTGFANPQYSRTLTALHRQKSNISGFISRGGILTVFGPLVAEHCYEWLPLEIKYICDYGSRQVEASVHECASLAVTSKPECDGYLVPGKGFEVALKDEMGRAVLAVGRHGEGYLVATSVHEYPSPEFIRWALSKAQESKI